MSKRMNVMELFQQAARQQQIPCNAWSELGPDNRVEINTTSDDSELPEFMSELSAPIDESASGAMCCGNNFLCLAKDNFLSVIDLTTGLRNDPSISNSAHAIVDLSFNSAANIVLYTDGVNVALVKVHSGGGVQLNGCVYLPNVGSTADPVRFVRFHPGGGPNFVTVQTTGWTIWDTARLIMKSTSVVETNRIPTLFRSSISDAKNFAEDSIPWKKSNVFAGKKVSPGVLAILKRGVDSVDSSGDSSGAVFFEFSLNGRFAVAVMDNNLVRAWKIGPHCATVEPLPALAPLATVVGNRTIVACAAVGDAKFAIAATDGASSLLCEFSLDNAQVDRVVTLSNCNTVTDIGLVGSELLIVAAGSLSILLGAKQVCPLRQPRLAKAKRLCIINKQKSSLFWQVQNDSRIEWLSQTYEVVSSQIEDNHFDDYRVDDQDASSVSGPDTVEAPDRLISSIRDSSSALVADVLAGQEALDAQLQAKIDRLVHAQVSEAVGEKLSNFFELEKAKTVKTIRRVMQTQFKQGMDRMFAQLGTELTQKISARKPLSVATLDKQIDQLAVRIDQLAVGTPPVLMRVGELLTRGTVMDAISALTSWLKKSPIENSAVFVSGCARINQYLARIGNNEEEHDPSMCCLNLLVLTEWLPDAEVLGCARFVVNALSSRHWSSDSAELRELCTKSLSKAIRNAVGSSPTDLVEAIRGLMMKLGAASKATTPTKGNSILQMLQKK